MAEAVTWDGKPEKISLDDNDIIPGTDSTTGATCHFTGATIKQYASTTPASASEAGTMSSAHYTKVEALDTQAVRDAKDAEIAKETLFYNNAGPVDGTDLLFYVMDGTYTLGDFHTWTESGTTLVTISKNGAAITGLDSISVSSTKQIDAPSSTTTITNGDLLQITFSSSSTPVGFICAGLVTKSIE